MVLPGNMIDVDSLHISYEDMLISQVMTAAGSPPQCPLTVENVLWNAIILHTADLTQPSQSALSKQCVHTGNTSTRQDISALVNLSCQDIPRIGLCFSDGIC